MRATLCFLMLLLGFQSFCQEPGTLDNSFGSNGKVELQLTTKDRASAIAIQTDGKIVFTGTANGALTIGRCNLDGSLDKSFAQGGFDTFEVSSHCTGNAIAVQPDGKIVVVGESCPPGTGSGCDFLAIRFNSDGSLDNSFNGSGIVTTGLSELTHDYCEDIAIQSDGKILLAGRTGDIMGLVRYNADGSLDATFNDSGKLSHGYFSVCYSEANCVAVQKDGNILVAGSVDPPANTSYDFALFRFKANGRRDSSFATNGVTLVDFAGDYDKAFDIAGLSDGKVIVAGYTVSPQTGNDFAMVKFNAEGSLDSSFGANGKVVHDLGGGDAAYAISVQADGRIVLAGSIDGTQFALARYNYDGSIDKSFGIDGVVKTVFNGLNESAADIALQEDGKIVAAGFVKHPDIGTAQIRKVALARYNGNWSSHVSPVHSKSDIGLYPNPAQDILYISNHSKAKIHLIQLVASDGRIIREINRFYGKSIDIHDVPSGFYFVRVYGEYGQTMMPIAIKR